jgi:hypothetical protein
MILTPDSHGKPDLKTASNGHRGAALFADATLKIKHL